MPLFSRLLGAALLASLKLLLHSWRASSCLLHKSRFIPVILAQHLAGLNPREPRTLHKIYDTTANHRSEDPSPATRPLHAPVAGPAVLGGSPLLATPAPRRRRRPAQRGRPRASPATARTSAEAARHAPGAGASPRRHSSVSHEPPRRQEGQGQDRRRRQSR